jgi:hypothetical protein
LKIVSGGQTGVDRAALDAALEAGVECGGWCPEGRKAEDGVIPARYPLTELIGAGYRQRTRRNVQDSDGTMVVDFGQPRGGTEQALLFCVRERKPYLLLDALEVGVDRAVARLAEFVELNGISVLNVAGPRASREPGAYQYAHDVTLKYLRQA